MERKNDSSISKSTDDFLSGKPEITVSLFNHFITHYKRIGNISVHPAKTMIGIATQRKRIAYVTQCGKNFIHVVFPFREPYYDNFCFQKIGQVGGNQYNHHLRILQPEDINEEVLRFMRLAYAL